MFHPVQSNTSNRNKKITLGGIKKKSSSKNNLDDLEGIENDFDKVLNQEVRTQQVSLKPLQLEEISQVVGELEDSGKLLSTSPSLKNFHQYRIILKKILKKIIPETFELKKSFSLNTSTMTQKEYHLIKNINQEMKSLLKMIENNQKENLAIASKVISIKGLVIDFYS